MIVRIWRGQAASGNADAYHRHVTTNVFPALNDIPGHHGAYLLRREADGQVEFLAVTFWDSIESIKTFAGRNPDIAVVEPEARAVLSDYDDFVRHYEVAFDSREQPSKPRAG
jgi:heme-degrading monooxygenase HmoA